MENIYEFYRDSPFTYDLLRLSYAMIDKEFFKNFQITEICNKGFYKDKVLTVNQLMIEKQRKIVYDLIVNHFQNNSIPNLQNDSNSDNPLEKSNLELLCRSIVSDLRRCGSVDIQNGVTLVCDDPVNNPDKYRLCYVDLVYYNHHNYIVDIQDIIADNLKHKEEILELVIKHVKDYIDFIELTYKFSENMYVITNN